MHLSNFSACPLGLRFVLRPKDSMVGDIASQMGPKPRRSFIRPQLLENGSVKVKFHCLATVSTLNVLWKEHDLVVVLIIGDVGSDS